MTATRYKRKLRGCERRIVRFRGDSLGFYICASAASILIAYAILCLFLRKTRTDGLVFFRNLFGCRRTRNSV